MKKLPRMYYGNDRARGRPGLYFFNPIGRFGAFDNFYCCRFWLDGRLWRSVEHYFQAQKHAPRQHLMARVHSARNGSEAKTRGRSIAKANLTRWEQKRYAVMQRALWAKFTQNSLLKKVLLSTGQMPLIECNPDDSLWGCGKDRMGQNLMGKALMDVRYHLQRRIKKCPADC